MVSGIANAGTGMAQAQPTLSSAQPMRLLYSNRTLKYSIKYSHLAYQLSESGYTTADNVVFNWCDGAWSGRFEKSVNCLKH